MLIQTAECGKEQLRSSAEDAVVRDVAQARTLTVIRQLDGQRKGSLMKFLSASKLLEIISLDDSDFDLSGADLGYLNFSGLDLGDVNLSGADMGDANLSKANLNGTILWYANLRGAQVTEEQLKTAKTLRGAIMPDGSKYDTRSKREDVVRLLQQAGGSSRLDLRNRDLKDTDLYDLDLHHANLSYANLLVANLRGANLFGANLRGADLFGADLRGAGLWDANLRRAQVTEEQLKTAKSLKGAIMPDGSKHP